MTLPRVHSGGLSEVFAVEFEVPTTAKRELLDLLQSVPGGAIGVSGPRGVGKTTLITSVCKLLEWPQRGQKILGFSTPAPTKYQARDFILHLFSTLCHRVISIEHANEDNLITRSHDPLRLNDQRRLLSHPLVILLLPFINPMRFIGIVLLFLGMILLTLKIESGLQPALRVQLEPPMTAANPAATSSTGQPTAVGRPFTDRQRAQLEAVGTAIADALGVKAGTLLLAGIFLLGIGSSIERVRARAGRVRQAWEIPMTDEVPLALRARALLNDIKFQRSYTIGSAGTLTLPIGVASSMSEAMSFAEQQKTLPEIRHQYQDFIKHITKDYIVLVGVDELDKVKSDEDVESFLNEIKVLFGIDKCFYVVSISESALTSFERRGMPIRDVFDSSFDEVIHVDFLKLEDSRRLLRLRVIGLPVPFVCFCHSFAGGLPRDLIRSCRKLLAWADSEPDERGLAALASKLLAEDLRSKCRAISMAAKVKDTEAIHEFLAKIHDLETTEVDSNTILEYLTEFMPRPSVTNDNEATEKNLSQDEKELLILRAEFSAYLLYCATMLDFFVSPQSAGTIEAAEKGRLFDRLAEVRQSMGIDPMLSLRLCQSVRDAEGMQPIERSPKTRPQLVSSD